MRIFGYSINRFPDKPWPKIACAVCRNKFDYEDMHGSKLYDDCKSCGRSGGSVSYTMCKECWAMLTPKQRWPFYEKRLFTSGWFDSLDEAIERISIVKVHILAGK